MRPLRRFLSLSALLFVLIFWFAPARAFAQAPAPPDVSTAPASGAAAESVLPKAWGDAVGSLAEKIAIAARGAGPVSIDMKNISTLSSNEASVIRALFDNRLRARRIAIVPSSQPGAAHVLLTLSESEAAYVWTAEFSGPPVAGVNPLAIVSVDKSPGKSEPNVKLHITLDKRLVWQQPSPFLDVAVFDNPAGTPSYRVVLDPTKIAYYRSSDSHWVALPATVSTLRSSQWLRTVSGRFDTTTNEVWVWDGNPNDDNSPAVHCSGLLDDPKQVECSPWKRSVLSVVPRWDLPGHEGSTAAELWQTCGQGSIVLSTGNADWTQLDSIQPYIVSESGSTVVPAGDPMPMDGPVIYLTRQDQGNTARAIVRNLATGNYEAYIVTATCSQ